MAGEFTLGCGHRTLTVSLLLTLFLPGIAHADLMGELSMLRGYTIVYTGTATAFGDSDGSAKDDFEGCEYGRKLILDDSYQVSCMEYSYSYAYRPGIVILARGASATAIIDGEVYDVLM